VYPRSFQDSNGDGIGDLPGLTTRLEYLAWLGVDAVWISPFYPSPMVDFGYDVTDHVNVDPAYGTLADFDALLARAHELGLRVLVDFIPGCTSDQHPWFKEARASRHGPLRDRYLWRDPAPDGGPPNNWLSPFGGPAWTLDEASGQYYLHTFLPEQPDLNWRNPKVVTAMLDVMRFWLERGVDGFRIAAAPLLVKDAQFRDEPPNPDYDPRWHNPRYQLLPVYADNQPEVHDMLRHFRRLLESYPGRIGVGEMPGYFPPETLAVYSRPDRLHLVFSACPLSLAWQAGELRACADKTQAAFPPEVWPTWVMGNHDRPRLTSRIGPAQARAAALLLLTMRGTPFIYYGDEIGMLDGQIAPEDRRDRVTSRRPPGPEGGPVNASRDPERTPMQWDTTPNAGFSGANAGFPGARPWLPIGPDYERRNVAAQRADTGSLLSLYRFLLRYRKGSPALQMGSYRSLDTDSPDCFAFLRETAEERLLIVLNLADTARVVSLPPLGEGQVITSTLMDRAERIDLQTVFLRENEGILFDVIGPESKENLP